MIPCGLLPYMACYHHQVTSSMSRPWCSGSILAEEMAEVFCCAHKWYPSFVLNRLEKVHFPYSLRYFLNIFKKEKVLFSSKPHNFPLIIATKAFSHGKLVQHSNSKTLHLTICTQWLISLSVQSMLKFYIWRYIANFFGYDHKCQMFLLTSIT